MSKSVITFGINKIVISIETLTKMSVLFYILMVLQSHSIVHGGATGRDFSTQPKNVTVKSGTHLKLPCSLVTNNQGVQGTCQWTKDGFGLGSDVDLPGWPRYSMTGNSLACDLSINPVLPEDEGVYQCQVGGAPRTAPSAAPPVKVRVVSDPGHPHIKQARVDDMMMVKEGDEVVLDCESQGGRPAAEILWSSEGIKVSDIIKRVELMKDGKSFKTSSTLRFTPPKSVSISCSAFNEEFKHQKTSKLIQIEVKNKPDIDMIFNKMNVLEGESLEVQCLVAKTDDDLNYSWFVNNQKVEGFTGSVLKLDPVTRTQNKAEIKCAAQNLVGVTEITKTLDVRFSPAIVLQPLSESVEAGEMVELTCSAEGNPEPKYVWFKGKSDELVGEGQHLRLVATEEKEGEYTCKVYSERFQTVSSMPATVSIKRKPKISAELIRYGSVGSDVILKCKVDSYSKKTKVLWTKNNDPIYLNSEKYQVFHSREKSQNQVKSDLLIYELTDDDFGEYGCFANNEIGTDYRIISLKKEEKLSFIAIAIYVNIAVGFLILMSLFIYYQCKRHLRKGETGNILPTTIYNTTFKPIYTNLDTSVFDELLLKNEKEEMKNMCEVKLDLDTSYE